MRTRQLRQRPSPPSPARRRSRPRRPRRRKRASKRSQSSFFLPATTASATPWPLTDRGGNEPIPNALAYAAQPAPIATVPRGADGASERRAPRRRPGEIRLTPVTPR